MTLWMMMLPTEMKLCCKMLGTAMTANRAQQIARRTAARLPLRLDSCFKRRMTTATAEHAADALAQERRPRHARHAHLEGCNEQDIHGNVAQVEDTARKMNGVLESPSAEKMPVATL